MTRRGRAASFASTAASASKSAAVRARPGKQTTGKPDALRRPWQRACSLRPSGADMKAEVGAKLCMRLAVSSGHSGTRAERGDPESRLKQRRFILYGFRVRANARPGMTRSIQRAALDIGL